jgi:hypothetical protein
MIGDDNYAIVLTQSIQWNALHLEIVFTPLSNLWEIGIVVGNQGAVPLQSLNDRDCGRFTEIIDILLVGNSQYQDL